ncbi:TPA: protease SohB [Morganella morganii]|nr:protease SohB [Morganella morganii]
MEFLSQYGLFLAETVTIVLAIIAIVVFFVMLSIRKGQSLGKLRLTDLGENYRDRQREMQHARMSEAEQKVWNKAFKKQQKNEDKKDKNNAKNGQTRLRKSCIYVIDFKGSLDAHEVESLREEITIILSVAEPGLDEVLVRLESPGGLVHAYGLAAAQLTRLREKNIRITIVVDKVAASGGYMMACVADKIVAAPFAIVGSIGVVAQVPNIHRLLKKNDIDVEMHTAGQYKRTLTFIGQNTDEGREKFQQELDETHVLFKSFVSQNRPSLDIDKVATGEHWYGTQAKELGLVDELAVSDDLIVAAIPGHEVIQVRYFRRKRLIDKITQSVMMSADRLILRWWQRGNGPVGK